MNPYVKNAMLGAFGLAGAAALLVAFILSIKWVGDTYGGRGLLVALFIYCAALGAIGGALSTTPPHRPARPVNE